MIPKVIHYCWFGRGPIPELGIKCIESWEKHMPDYEIKEWNEDNFDVNMIPYTKEAYEAKKFAFVSDFARFWILYHHGGVYFDTDVELLKPLDDIISKGPFMGAESDCIINGVHPAIAPGLGLAAEVGMPIYQKLINYYENTHFILPNGKINDTTIVFHTTNLLAENGLTTDKSIQIVAGIWIYPKEYFCPKRNDVITITEHTYSIHHYASSWRNPLYNKIRELTLKVIGVKGKEFIGHILHPLGKKQ